LPRNEGVSDLRAFVQPAGLRAPSAALGLDRHPKLLPMMFGNYEKIVYLAQTDDPALEAQARARAARTGYGDLTGFLAGAAGV